MSFVRTVSGDVDPASLGVTLAHEHLIIDSPVVVDEWPHIHLASVEEAIAETALCRDAGVAAMVDAMPIGSGGDPIRLREISSSSGVRLVASTGMHTIKYYRDASWAMTDSVDALADRFIECIDDGMDGARAGVLKVATAGLAPSDQERRLFEAAAITEASTGVPLLTHCEEGRGGMAQVELLASLNVPLDRVALSHTDKVIDLGYHRELLEAGAFLCYDQGLRSPEQTVRLVSEMVTAGFGDRLLIGTDGARRTLWSTLGGAPGLSWIHAGFRDLLTEGGLSSRDVEELFVDNPARWLTFSA